MTKIGIEHPTEKLKMNPTLWFCRKCGAFISIYSVDVIGLAICPICADETMESRGSFETILKLADL